MKMVRFLSLGCPKNLVDSEVMLGHLSSGGYYVMSDNEVSASPNNCDVFIINTCCFVKDAEKESRDIIKQAVKQKRKAGYKIIVSGCLAQRYHQQLNKDFKQGIDGIIGLHLRDKIVSLCNEVLKNELPHSRHCCYWDETAKRARIDNHRVRITAQHYAYLRIAEGCDNRCSYCVIPHLHGSYRSKPLNLVIDEAKSLVSDGVKEINLIAQDTTSYGKDINGNLSLSQLIRELDKVKDLKWIRLLYTHPAHFDNELIKTIGTIDKVVKYIDLPIQHISDNILSLMRRNITGDKIRKLIYRIREKIPDVFLRTSVIVGFPGEREEDFQQVLDFIEETGFERLGAFEYSKEQGTDAYGFNNQIPVRVKRERLDALMSLQQKIALKKNHLLINKKLPVIIDDYSENGYTGRTYGDAPEVDGTVIVKSIQKLTPGNIINVTIVGVKNYDLVGKYQPQITAKRQIKSD
jgi:ribosomal protein S12 methylthiotransferase